MKPCRGVLLALVLAWPAPLVAQERPGREEVLGTVRRLAGDRLEIRTTAGDSRIVDLDATTRYLHEGRDASRSALRRGVRVAVEAEDVSGRWVARFVRIGAAAAAGPPPAHVHGEPAPSPAPPVHVHDAPPAEARRRSLFQSDMTLMAGMTARDPMAGMAMPSWEWMTMGMGRLVYNRQGGLSGEEEVESSNWTMVMAQRDAGPGRLTLMIMSSLEPGTLGGSGSPQLFQTGETFEGRLIVDRQHPHDLFMNLSSTYRLALGDQSAAWLQAAPRGEPALGPTAFMHRASAGENPTAVLGHHFQDSTHITDNVITLGAGWRRLSVEGSVFHGREPDEGRWDLDPGALDSWSARLKVQLGGGWSGQASYGFLEEPEALEEGDVRRTTASLHYAERGQGPFAASLVWGRNRESHGTFESFLVEGAYQLTHTDHLYARAEQVDRDLDLLIFKGGPPPSFTTVMPPGSPAPRSEDVDRNVEVRALTLGYLKDLHVFRDTKWLGPLHVGLGADITLYQYESILDEVYGESPLSVHAFLRVRWGAPHGAHQGHGSSGQHQP